MVTYDIIKEKLLDYHLLTGEALGSRQTALPRREGAGNSTEWALPRGHWAFEGLERSSAQNIIETSRIREEQCPVHH